jgi:hypothetical protein
MLRKTLIVLALGVFVGAMAGVAAADAYVETMMISSSSTAVEQQSADPEFALGQGASWQEREPVETGSMPASHGNSPELRCCGGDSGPTQDQAGATVLRQSIDDGP